MAAQHVEPAVAGQQADHVLGQAIAEIIGIGLLAQIGERQHRDRRLAVATAGKASVDLGDPGRQRFIGRAQLRRFLGPVPMKRKPRRWIVLISACRSPSSPIALRAALIRLLSAASDTIRPFQIVSNNSSLLTTRSRFRTR